MKTWLRRKLMEFLHPPEENLVPISKESSRGLAIQSPDIDVREHGAIEFTVTNAQGGRVVSTRRWDRKKDQWTYKLHIITDNEDFGEEIKNIVFMEDLSR